MQNARLHESQAGSKTAVKNINNLRHADDTTLMAESKEELKIHYHKGRKKCLLFISLYLFCTLFSLALSFNKCVLHF